MSSLDAPRGAPHRTKQAFVYRTLHDAISTCEIRPGERLIIDDLARRLQVSAIPVREALQVLQSEGLVITVPHVGATVAPVSRDSIVDVFTVLEGLESVACRARRGAGNLRGRRRHSAAWSSGWTGSWRPAITRGGRS